MALIEIGTTQIEAALLAHDLASMSRERRKTVGTNHGNIGSFYLDGMFASSWRLRWNRAGVWTHPCFVALRRIL